MVDTFRELRAFATTAAETRAQAWDASGNATWDYSAVGFTKTPAVVHLAQAMDTSNPITCNYTARSQASVSVHCWRTSLLGLLTNLYSGSVAGATVTLVARAVP